jgi:hypothetical protein
MINRVNESNQNLNLFETNSGIKKNNLESNFSMFSQTPKTQIYQQTPQDSAYDSEPESICSKTNANSLISISKEVYVYLREMIESKGSNVTEYILKQLKKSQSNLSFKNIQRRVYDAINVMNAVGILHKEKNNLFFKGKMNFSSSKCKRNKNESSKYLREMVRQKRNLINSKQHELVGISAKV